MRRIRFFERQEKFLLIELHPRGTEGLVVSLDGDRVLSINKSTGNITPQDIARRLKVRSSPTIIVSAHPSMAVTVTAPLKLERDPDITRAPIGNVELENLLAKMLVKVFNQYREPASRDLGIPEIDTILVGNRVDHFKIDGHRVMNPLGFSGKKIEAVIQLTLTTRRVFEEWQRFFNHEDFFFTEVTRAELTALHKLHSPPLHLLLLTDETASYHILDRAALGTLLYRGKLSWRFKDCMRSLSEEFGVSAKTAEHFYERYRRRNVSPHMSRAIAKVLRPHFDELAALLMKTKMRGKIYVDTSVPLPFTLPHRGRGYVLEDLPVADLFHKLGFTVEAGLPGQGQEHSIPRLFAKLAPFVEFYYDKGDSAINHWLRRRLHWLTPADRSLGRESSLQVR